MSTPFLTSCCRVCLAQEDVMIYVFDKVEEYDMSLSDLLEICGDIKIISDDLYTKLICKDCTAELLMVAKFRRKCKASEGTLTQLSNAMDPSELQPKVAFVDVDDSTSLPGKNDIEDDGDIVHECTPSLNESSSCSIVVESGTTQPSDDEDNLRASSAPNAVDFPKHEPYEEIEYLDANGGCSSGKNAGIAQQPIKNQLHYGVIGETFDSEAVQYIIMEPSVHHEDESFSDIIEDCHEENTKAARMSDDDGGSVERVFAEKEQYEIIISDAVDYDNGTVSSETVLLPAEEDYFSNDGVRVVSESAKVVINHNCDICGAGFMHLSNMKKHLLNHKDVGYVCTICSLVFTDADKCNAHQQLVHAQPSVKCAESGRKIETVASRRTSKAKIVTVAVSQSSRKGEKRKTHRCPHCDKWFVSNSMLTAHVRVHTGERPYACDQCSKTFTTRGGLELHVRRHMGVKPFECSICSRRFVESSNLRVHMRIHTGEKPHKCNQCGRSFSRVFLLQIHQRTHTGERPYPCPTCNKAFAQQGDLSAHKRIHTGERPHMCGLCSKGFIKSSALTAHMRRHEKNAKYENHTDHDESLIDCIEEGDDDPPHEPNDATGIDERVRIEYNTFPDAKNEGF